MAYCELCGRDVTLITQHHLIPKQKGGDSDQIVNLCRPCHKTIHATFTNTQLVQDYNTLEQLKQANALQNYLKWI